MLAGVGLIGAADLTGSVWLAAGLCLASVAIFIFAVRMRAAGGGLFPRAAGDPTTTIGSAYLSYFALTAAGMCFSVYAPALLQKLYGLSPLVAGYAAGLEALGWTVAALGVAGLGERWHGPIIRLGVVCIVVSLAALAVVMRQGPLWAILVAAFVMGAGFGFTSGFIGRRVIAAADDETERELASAGINSVRQIGNAAGACLAGIVANLLGVSAGVSLAARRRPPSGCSHYRFPSPCSAPRPRGGSPGSGAPRRPPERQAWGGRRGLGGRTVGARAAPSSRSGFGAMALMTAPATPAPAAAGGAAAWRCRRRLRPWKERAGLHRQLLVGDVPVELRRRAP